MINIVYSKTFEDYTNFQSGKYCPLPAALNNMLLTGTLYNLQKAKQNIYSMLASRNPRAPFRIKMG